MEQALVEQTVPSRPEQVQVVPSRPEQVQVVEEVQEVPSRPKQAQAVLSRLKQTLPTLRSPVLVVLPELPVQTAPRPSRALAGRRACVVEPSPGKYRQAAQLDEVSSPYCSART